MKIVMQRDDCDDKIKVLLEFGGGEYMRANMTHFDRLLIAECERSEKISDKLLALETIARRIEESSATPSTSAESQIGDDRPHDIPQP